MRVGVPMQGRNLRRLSRMQGGEVGFTLIELMITVAIVAILAALAYPAYQDSVRKARRTDAKAALMDTAHGLERCFTQFSAYNSGSCSLVGSITGGNKRDSGEEYYEVTGVLTATGYALTATAPAGSAQDSDTACKVMTLNSTSTQGPAACW